MLVAHFLEIASLAVVDIILRVLICAKNADDLKLNTHNTPGVGYHDHLISFWLLDFLDLYHLSP